MTDPPIFAIDARAAAEVPAGRGRLVRELLRALNRRKDDDARFVLFARRRWEEPLDERFTWALHDAPDAVWHARVGRVAGRTCDALLATNSYLSPLLTDLPTVLVVYDLVALDPATSPNRRSALVERATLAPAVARSARILCISQATREALLARHPGVAARTSVALLAAATDTGEPSAAELADLPAPGYVLAVGTLEPRKNLPRLVAAYSALPAATQAAHPLVVVGAAGWRMGDTLHALLSLGDRCRLLGHVSDGALVELYRRCALFCYPSLSEGFGLPVLEAMAQGAPVLTSDRSSLPEVGGEAALYVDPWDVADIARGMGIVLGDDLRRADLVTRGPLRAAEFSWDAFAGRVSAELRAAR